MTPQNPLGIIVGILVTIVVLLIAGGMYYVTTINSESPITSATVPSKLQEREEVAKRIVTSFLKSPGSAQFPDIVIKKMVDTNDRYIIFGEVDSQNGFGALLRTHFHMILLYKGGEITDMKNWTIDTLNLGDVVLIADEKRQDPPLFITGELLTAVQKVEELYRGMEQFDVEGLDLQ